MKDILFQNGRTMPAVGLGLWQAEDPQEFEAAVNKALEIGYRHFDTAFLYRNEGLLGNVLKKWLDSGKGKREELFITTKLPMHGMQPNKVEHFMKLSLKALNMEYVDLYLVHSPVGFVYVSDNELVPKGADGSVLIDNSTDLLAIWKEMEAQVDAGRAKAIGVSNFTPAQIERVVKLARIQPANHQIEVNAYFQQKELREVCQKHRITIVAYAPLGSPGRTAYYYGRNGMKFECPPILEESVVSEIAKKHNKSNGQVLLRHLVQLGVAPIPKSTSPERLRKNFEIFDFELTEEDMNRLESLDKGKSGRSFTMAVFKGADTHPEFPFE